MIVVLGEPIKKWECIYKVCEAVCCKIPREVTLLDIKRIVEATGKAPEDFISITTDKGYIIPFALKRRGGGCVFLGKNYRCVLHDTEAKPILCRMYPFMLHKIVYGDEPMLFINPVPDCPGYGKGQAFTQKHLAEIKKQGQIYVTELRKIARYRHQGINPKEILQKEL